MNSSISAPVLSTNLTERRRGVDRRRDARGGRRASDTVRLAACAAMVVCLGTASARAQAPSGWSTSGTKILGPTSGEYAIGGINWYGFETTNYAAHGLWSKDYKYILDQIKLYGYGTIRLPYSNQMWEANPVPAAIDLAGCSVCSGKRARDLMAMIVNYAGSIGLHVILDNHRSNAGNSAQESGLWYTAEYSEQSWIRDWVGVQEWTHGIQQTLGAPDTIIVNTFAADGLPTVLGFDLRNEPHTATGGYLTSSTWGSGDGISPAINPNPNPFAPACVATSSCHDWRLAAERAADTLLAEALKYGWAYPLIFVEGVSQYPTAGGNAASGPYDGYWWGGNLLGVNGNSTNPGAPVVLNAGGAATALGAAIYNQLVYSVHDYGPITYRQSWFNASTCYATGCSSSSLADTWKKYWAYVNLPGGINPVGPGGAAYPWANTGHASAPQAPIYIGEFGTANTDADLYTSGSGSQGQWNTSIVNFIQSSYSTAKTALNDSGIPVSDLQWTYWALNNEDGYSVLGAGYTGLSNSKKEYSFLCYIQQGLLAVPMGSTSGRCGSTGTLPVPDSSASLVVVPPAPAGLTATGLNAQISLAWSTTTGATTYNVKASTTNGGPYQIVQTGIASTSFVHTGLTNGVTYYYVVSSVGSGGESVTSNQVSATPVAPTLTQLSNWWPANGATLRDVQPFKARMENMALTDYRMYWQVDGGALTEMFDNVTGGPHKEGSVNVNPWSWRGSGPYVVTFVAKDRTQKLIQQKSVTVYVAR